MCVKSCDSHTNIGEYLQQLEDKREVAGLQLKLLESLKSLRPSPYLQDAIAKLNTELFEISPVSNPAGIREQNEIIFLSFLF